MAEQSEKGLTPEQEAQAKKVVGGLWAEAVKRYPVLAPWSKSIATVLLLIGGAIGGVELVHTMKADPAPTPPAPAPIPAPPAPAPTIDLTPLIKSTEGMRGDLKLSFDALQKRLDANQTELRKLILDAKPKPPPTPAPPAKASLTVPASALPGDSVTVKWTVSLDAKETELVWLSAGDQTATLWRYVGGKSGQHSFDLGQVRPGTYSWAIGPSLVAARVTAPFVVKGDTGPTPPVPPSPVPPGPTPTPPSPTPTASKLYILTFDDELTRGQDVSALLGDKTYWNGVIAKGHQFRAIDTKNPEATPWAPWYTKNGISIPSIVFLNADDGVTKMKYLATYGFSNDTARPNTIQPTSAAVDKLISQYTGRGK